MLSTAIRVELPDTSETCPGSGFRRPVSPGLDRFHPRSAGMSEACERMGSQRAPSMAYNLRSAARPARLVGTRPLSARCSSCSHFSDEGERSSRTFFAKRRMPLGTSISARMGSSRCQSQSDSAFQVLPLRVSYLGERPQREQVPKMRDRSSVVCRPPFNRWSRSYALINVTREGGHTREASSCALFGMVGIM